MSKIYKYKVLPGQNLIDIAMQLYGSPEAVLAICLDNNLSISKDITPGQLLNIDSEKIIDKKLVEYYLSRKTEVSTLNDKILTIAVKLVPGLIIGQSLIQSNIDAIASLNSNITNNSQVQGTLSILAAFTNIKNGYLYNWYAISDSKNIASSGWHVPTNDELTTLKNYLGGYAVCGGKLREVGLTYWNSDTDATNSSGFTGRGGGDRSYSNGAFYNWQYYGNFWTQSVYNASMSYCILMTTSNNVQLGSLFDKKEGMSCRLIKDSTNKINGQTGFYIGNDGKVYRTVCIGTQEWLSESLAETMYRDLTAIPSVTDANVWKVLSTGAKCAYNNNESNVLM